MRDAKAALSQERRRHIDVKSVAFRMASGGSVGSWVRKTWPCQRCSRKFLQPTGQASIMMLPENSVRCAGTSPLIQKSNQALTTSKAGEDLKRQNRVSEFGHIIQIMHCEVRTSQCCGVR